jgi:hypothetical protein
MRQDGAAHHCRQKYRAVEHELRQRQRQRDGAGDFQDAREIAEPLADVNYGKRYSVCAKS